jgi:hypothetical protein
MDMTPSPEPSPAMSIQITLTPGEEQKLTELARARGKDPAAHAHDVVTAYLNGADQGGSKSFEEILGYGNDSRQTGPLSSRILHIAPPSPSSPSVQ